MDTPVGVRIVGYIALFGSVALGLLAWIGSFAGGVGMAGNTSGIPLRVLWLVASFSVFALVGLCLSIAVLRGWSSKYLWYALMVYWISLLAFSFVRDLTNFENIAWNIMDLGFATLILPTYVYSACCIGYFLSRKPRQYFLKLVQT